MAICSGWKTFLQQFWQVWTLCDCAPVTQKNLYSLVIHNSQLNVHEQSPCPIHVGWISRAKTSGLSRLSDLPDILRDRLLFPAWVGGGARGLFSCYDVIFLIPGSVIFLFPTTTPTLSLEANCQSVSSSYSVGDDYSPLCSPENNVISQNTPPRSGDI